MATKIIVVLTIFGIAETVISHGLTLINDWLSEQGLGSSDFVSLPAICDLGAEVAAFCVSSTLMVYVVARVVRNVSDRPHEAPSE